MASWPDSRMTRVSAGSLSQVRVKISIRVPSPLSHAGGARTLSECPPPYVRWPTASTAPGGISLREMEVLTTHVLQRIQQPYRLGLPQVEAARTSPVHPPHGL